MPAKAIMVQGIAPYPEAHCRDQVLNNIASAAITPACSKQASR